MKVKLDFRGGIWHEGTFYRWEAGEEVDLPEEVLRALGVSVDKSPKKKGEANSEEGKGE